MVVRKKTGKKAAAKKTTRLTVANKQKKSKKALKAAGAKRTKGGKKPLAKEGPLCIVGIGASGGGLEALEGFLSNMPSDSGIAFVLVTHLDPTHKSIMAELLMKYTRMEVLQAEDGIKVMPNRLYIIPPDKDMAIMDGALQLLEPQVVRGLRHPIDFFFRSLAKDQDERAVCIIMSGAGTDGTFGLKDIKGGGGMVMVQSPDVAKYDGMPLSAIDTGLADFVLPTGQMPEQLMRYVNHPYIAGDQKRDLLMKMISNNLQKMVFLIRNQTGHDFSYYKENTIIRRVERRMNVNQIDNVTDYINYLQRNSIEVEMLFNELLIGVTNFFRDPKAFESIKKGVVPQLFEKMRPGDTLRVWVPGCATGEEAYSIAIILKEYMDSASQNYSVQIFATDIDNTAIEKARAGIYPVSIAGDMAPERLSRFFTKGDNTFQIKKEIREMVVFAVQDLIKDPPFTKLSLVSCRNLLIYLNSQIQKKVIPLFHFVLVPDGTLFLGSSETIGEFSELFSMTDKKWKIFKRKRGITIHPARFEIPELPLRGVTEAQRTGVRGKSETTVAIGEAAKKILIDDYAPPCVVINEKNNILYIYGKTGRYLEPAPGEATFNIIEMAREGLEYELSSAIREATNKNKRVVTEAVSVKVNDSFSSVNIEVKPITRYESMKGLMMVVFTEPLPSQPSKTAKGRKKGDDKRLHMLETELMATKDRLQHTIEEQETTMEELQSTNEELQASNEELQSANEELETSKEEIQSVNEELITVNSELQNKLDELAHANNDMNNLLAGTDIATVFLNNDLEIKRFTPMAAKIINLIQSDIGRPIEQVTTTILDVNIVEEVIEVLNTLVFKEKDVRTMKGIWYLMRILPYRTEDNVIDGVIITFSDITSLKHAREYAESIVDTVREPLLVMDKDLRIITANNSFYNAFKVSRKETENQLIYNVGNRQWNIPDLRILLDDIIPKNREFNGYLVEHKFPKIGHKKMILNARRIYESDEKTERILLAIEDITGANAERAVKEGKVAKKSKIKRKK
jgi:two-component system CheB/CheR fusion protein